MPNVVPRFAATALSVVALLGGSGCGGKVVYEGPGAGGGGVGGGDSIAGNAAGTGNANDVDLEPICKKFCDAYESCAPQTQCKIGCMSSPVLACKKEYAADVVCITNHIQSCAGFTEPCAAEQQAYQDCESQH